EALGGVREHVLVRLLDGVDAGGELAENLRRNHAWPAGFAFGRSRPTGQRLGSWCSRYWRRVMYPRTIDFVIHHFSGRTAKYTCAITRPTRPTPARPWVTYVNPHAVSLR